MMKAWVSIFFEEQSSTYLLLGSPCPAERCSAAALILEPLFKY